MIQINPFNCQLYLVTNVQNYDNLFLSVFKICVCMAVYRYVLLEALPPVCKKYTARVIV